MPDPQPKPFRTVDARPDAVSMVKPGEMIDVIEMTPLTLSDRRVYNMLIENAWDTIDQPVAHSIELRALRGTRDANDRVGESIERLMASIARLEIELNGKRYIRRVQLLGETDEDKAEEGLLYYRFPPGLRAIIRKSRMFARLRKDIIFALSSKYALALYELCEKRVNLDWKWSEEFTVERFRQLLGVDPGKLKAFKNFNQKAIQPAVAEVNFLSDFGCSVEPVTAGRKVIKIRLTWWKKNLEDRSMG
jgi:nucleoside diphosphate kinase